MSGIQTDISGALAPGPATLRQEYIPGGTSYADIFRLAGWMNAWHASDNKKNQPLCLGTSSKAVLMAALLASLGGGPDLVLPASISGHVIAETCFLTGAATVLSDRPLQLPAGIQSVSPRIEETAVPKWRMLRKRNEPFLFLYTGGSTGAPKLWPKTPDNLIGEARNLQQVFGIRNTDILVATVPPLHIYGLLFSVLLPFVARACVIGETPYFPREIIRTLDRTEATVFIASPMHYRTLSASSFRTKHLRLAFSSGGFLEESHSLHFTAATGAGVNEIYGSTETGGIAARCRAQGQSAWQPFSCTRWTISRGRLAVASPFVSPGLRHNKQGFFVTGDRASDTGHATFVLHGRADGIIKIGGKRVDITAIEQKIKSLPGITDAWVLSLPSRAGREHDIAALVVSGKTLTSLRKLFARVLEPTHVPRRIVRVPSLPVTPSGKRDHQAAASLFVHNAGND